MRVGGRELETRWWGGAAAKHPLVLLHEGLGSVSLWKEFPAALAERTGRRVLAFSRWGHGQSDPPDEPHTVRFMHDEAAMLPAILDAAQIDKAILLGHSDGGSIALIAAAQHPERVDSLVLEAPHVFVEDLSIASIEETTRRFRHGDLRPRLQRHHRDVDLAFSGWSDVWLHPEFRDWNIEAYLPRIACPLLLVQGEDDEYGTLRQLDAISRQVRGPVQKEIIANCGHSPHRDQPELVLSAMTAFVKTRG